MLGARLGRPARRFCVGLAADRRDDRRLAGGAGGAVRAAACARAEPFIPPRHVARPAWWSPIVVTAFFAIGTVIGLTIMTPLLSQLVLA